MLRDSETNDRIPLVYPGKTLIGRAKGCDIIPSSTSISKKHAQIEVVLDDSSNTIKEIWIEDLGSRNGTFTGTPDSWKIINEKRRRLKMGDFIKFGLSVTYYRLERLQDEFAEVDNHEPPQAQTLAVKQYSQQHPPDVIEDPNPPFQDNNHLLYSNIDNEQHHHSPPPSQYQRPPVGSSINRSRDRDSERSERDVSTKPTSDNSNNKIHVSIEYPEGNNHRKPPVSIRIGGHEDEDTKMFETQQENGLSWNDINSNTQTEQLQMPPEPVPMTFNQDYDISNSLRDRSNQYDQGMGDSNGELYLRNPTLASSLDLNIDSNRRSDRGGEGGGRNKQQSQSQAHADATARSHVTSHTGPMWDTDVSDSYMQHLNDLMGSSSGTLPNQNQSQQGFSNFKSYEQQQRAPSSLSVSQSPLDVRGEAFSRYASSSAPFSGNQQMPPTRESVPSAIPLSPSVSSSLMNPILMEEQDRRPQQQQFQPQPYASMSGSMHRSQGSWHPFSSGQLPQQLQPPTYPPLSAQERQMLEDARDSLASGIRVANKTLGGVLDMQDWRQYASRIMGQASDLSGAVGGREGGRDGLSGNENESEDKDSKKQHTLEEAAALLAEEKSHAFLRAVLSPQVSQALAKETEDASSGKGGRRSRGDSAQAALQQAVRNLRFLGDYDDTFSCLDQNPDEGGDGGKEFDGVLYNKIIDNTVGLLSKRAPRSGVVGALDECFGVLESVIGGGSGGKRSEEEPFKSMQLPPYAVGGGITRYLEKTVLPKLSGLKTFNLGMMTAPGASPGAGEQPSPQGILSNYQLEQVNKRILGNVQQDLLPVLQLLVDLRHMMQDQDARQSMHSDRSGDVIASQMQKKLDRSGKHTHSKQPPLSTSTSSALLGGLSAEYSPGELRLSAPTSTSFEMKNSKQNNKLRNKQGSKLHQGVKKPWTSSSKLRRSKNHHSIHDTDDDDQEDDDNEQEKEGEGDYEYDDEDFDNYEGEEGAMIDDRSESGSGGEVQDLSPYGEDIEMQVVEGRQEAAAVYESWVQVKLMLQSLVSGSGALTDQAAAELQREVSQWYRHYIASGQVSGKLITPIQGRARGKSTRRGRSHSPRSRRDMDGSRGRSTSPRHRLRSSDGNLSPYDSNDISICSDDDDSGDAKLKHARHNRSGQVVEMSKNGMKSQLYIPRKDQSKSQAPRTKEEIMEALAQTSESEEEVRIQLKEQLKAEALKNQILLEEQRADRARLAAEIEKKEFEKLSTEAQLERTNKLHTEKVLRGIDRMRRRIFIHFLSKRFRTWQLFTERLRANSIVSSLQTQQQQQTVAEKLQAAQEAQEKERRREAILRKERELAEEAAAKRAAQAEQELHTLLEQQKLKDAEVLEQRVLQLTQEKEQLLQEERRMSSLARAKLLEERDQIIETKRNKEIDLTKQIQSLVATNDTLAIQSEKRVRVLRLLSSMGDRLDRVMRLSFSKWAQFSAQCLSKAVALQEKKKTIKRMLRILLGVQTSSLRDVTRRAFRQWDRVSSAARHLSSVSSSEEEITTGLRSRINDLQEELLALTSRDEGAASWVAERALNRELSSANHDLEQRFTQLQSRLLEVARVPQAERKQLVNAVLLDREKEVARSRKEVRVLREQVAVLEKYLRIPVSDRPTLSPKASSGAGPATATKPSSRGSSGQNNYGNSDNTTDEDNVNSHTNNHREGENEFYDQSGSTESKFYQQKFKIGSKMTKQDALQVVLGEMKNLQKQNSCLKEDNARKGMELAEETNQHHQLSLSLGVLQQRLLSKERRLDLLTKELIKQIGSTEVALLLDSPLVK